MSYMSTKNALCTMYSAALLISIEARIFARVRKLTNFALVKLLFLFIKFFLKNSVNLSLL